MLVNLKADWFAPSDKEVLNKEVRNNEAKIVRSRSGRLYRRRDNPHRIPEWLVEYLPKSAVPVEKKIEVDEAEMSLKDFDLARTAGQEVEKKVEKYDNLAKARAALAAKKAAEKENK